MKSIAVNETFSLMMESIGLGVRQISCLAWELPMPRAK